MIKPFYLDLTEIEISDIQIKLGEILRSGTLILGKYTEEFESEFAKYIGTKYAVSLNSCTSALETLLIMKGANKKKIAVPTNTNFATVIAIIRAGGTPVYMDMTREYFVPNLDILKYTYEKHPDIKVVVWVHIGGMIAPDFANIVEFCKSNKLFLFEDAAHAHGSKMGGIFAGNFGDGGAFSFFPTKVMTTIEGGMITTNSMEDAKLAKSIRNQGKRGGNYGGLHHDFGNSWRMSEIEAYIGLVQLAKLNTMVGHRTKMVNAIISILKNRNIAYCDISHMQQMSLYKFIVKFNNNCTCEELKDKFKNDGVILGGGVYEIPCHRQPVFESVEFAMADVKEADEFCPKHICLPITSGTTETDVATIIAAIEKNVQ